MTPISLIFERETGWKRHGMAICQDLDALAKVKTFTYDLSCTEFVEYFQNRTGQMITLVELGWERVVEEFANPNKPCETHWMITRAKLQDCWCLFLELRLRFSEPVSIPSNAEEVLS